MLIIFPFFAEDGDDGINWNGTFFDVNMKKNSLLITVQLHRSLIGFYFSQYISGFYHVAFFFEPSDDDTFFHRIAQSGHSNNFCHCYFLFYGSNTTGKDKETIINDYYQNKDKENVIFES